MRKSAIVLLAIVAFASGIVMARWRIDVAGKIEAVEVDTEQSTAFDDAIQEFPCDGVDSERSQKALSSLARVGEDYLNEVISRVYRTVQNSGVDVSAIPPAALYTLIMVEHFSVKAVDDLAIQGEIDRILTAIGTDKVEAYRDTVSSQKARGLCQIIPPTYRSLRARYPRLLMADFFKGTADHFNAITAQLLLAHEDLRYLFSKSGWRGNKDAQENFFKDSQYLGEYLAVAYNGGGPRAHRWEASGRTIRLSTETAKYLVKFGQVWNVLHSPSSMRGVAALAPD